MPKRQRRTRAQWRDILRRFDRSGLGPRAFCRHEGLSLSSLQRWRSQEGTSPRRSKFIELTSPRPARRSTTAWALEIELPSGVCVRLRG